MKNLWKEIYAALEIKHVAFKMYKKDDNNVFEFLNNKIVLSDNSVSINGSEYDSVQHVVSFIKNY